MNVGIREALARGADRVLLVNSDMIVPPDCVQRTRACARWTRPARASPDRWCWPATRPDRVASLGMTYRRSPAACGIAALGVDRVTSSLRAGPVDGVSGLSHARHARRCSIASDCWTRTTSSASRISICACARRRRASRRCWRAGRAPFTRAAGRSARRRRPGCTSPRAIICCWRAGPRGGSPWSAGHSPWRSIIALNAAHAVRARGGSVVSRLSAVGRGTLDYFRGRLGAGPLA